MYCKEGVKNVNQALARGNFTVDIAWSENKATKISVTSEHNNILRLKLNEKTGEIKTEKAHTVENGILIAEVAANETVEIEFILTQ